MTQVIIGLGAVSIIIGVLAGVYVFTDVLDTQTETVSPVVAPVAPVSPVVAPVAPVSPVVAPVAPVATK
jgi:hypothetical protein